MPRRTDISSILIIGAGPIVIGQACEFDYSGTQAVKTLKAEGYRVILVNSNPATIMTDPEFADATYIEPITPEYVEKIIARERPDALLPTMGGQTALNCAKALAESGVLAKYNVELIGADLNAINKAEDRQLFGDAMARIGLEVPKNVVVKSIEEAREALKVIGLPSIIRPSFTMGGSGGGIAYNKEEFEAIVASGLDASPVGEVMIDESVLGWKEYEMEVVRDKTDNCIIVCSIENIDPMGVHTGDSITVAPALTLTDKEYQIMRNASIAVLREIGVDTGGSNVQFAVNPENGRMVVIEMNPRVSRSSALASKATGFPIAKVAAKLAVGYTLDEVANDVVGRESRVQSPESSKKENAATSTSLDSGLWTLDSPSMPASFEPTIDYIVVKIPRFTFEKFPGADTTLTTAMKSVGESMAMGRNFPEALQKALRSLETGLTGLDEITIAGITPPVPPLEERRVGTSDVTRERRAHLIALRSALSIAAPDRLLRAAQALRLGMGAKEICEITKFDPWFIAQLERIIAAENWVKKHGLPSDADSLAHLKSLGFSDKQLARLATIAATNSVVPLPSGERLGEGAPSVALLSSPPLTQPSPPRGEGLPASPPVTEKTVRALRHALNVRPVFKRVDTCAAEFESQTPYMYSTYEDSGFRIQDSGLPGCESNPTNREKIIILGGGPNRIGQGIEFDYCCVHASYALREGAASPNPESRIPNPSYETIMINCNPETVSTDYDTSDRLYFEPLTAEDVIEVIEREAQNGSIKGVIVQFGGQTPLKLAHALEEAGIPIIGTSVDSIDLAEDRERFQQLLHTLNLKQPKNAICKHADEVVPAADAIGYPVVVRPSYVLGGRAMKILYDAASLKAYVSELLSMFGDGPVLLDSYLQDAIELDVDCLCDGEDTFVAGIMEHIEEAGIHSGDSACSLPPYSLPDEIVDEVRKQTIALAKALKVKGLMNVQFAVKKDSGFRIQDSVKAETITPPSSSLNAECRMPNAEIYILEVNPRASRTTPFVAKATGIPIAKIAARLMAGSKLSEFNLPDDKTHMKALGHIAVKEAVFPFARFAGVDVLLGPEMKSTGETMGIDRNFAAAFGKGFIGSGSTLPKSGTAFISVRDRDKEAAATIAQELISVGFTVVCTRGTGEHLQALGIPVEIVNKVHEGRPHIVDMMKDGLVQLVFNTTDGAQAIADSASIRKTALFGKIPYATTIAGSKAMAQAIAARIKSPDGFGVAPLQSYFAKKLGKKDAA
jgi:carbamoyl-phosphate synthase large subunit